MIENRERRRPLVLLASALVTAAALLAPAAAVAEEADCMMCHEKLGEAFQANVHSRIATFEVLGGQTGCATCHGDGAAHMDAGGDPDQITGFGESMTAEEVADACLTCHRSGSLHDWQGSTHALSDVGCSDCHRIHPTEGEAEGDPETCWSCHGDVRAQFQYPSHHPLREGHMRCASCHTPHGSSIGLLKTEERPAELCLSCHTQYTGPFIFEHEPVYEGCDACHAPHGAVANNLLTQNEPFLCLQCHEMHFHAGLEGEEGATEVVPRYDPTFDPDNDRFTYEDGVPNPWGRDGYRRAFTTKCTQCHTEVHGSDLPTQTVPSMGRGLMR
jgi:DmsE family decaheme c-type cytochrome